MPTLYRLREKIWSLRDTYTIMDETGAPVYSVKGKFLSWGDQLDFRDATGNDLFRISQTLISLRPHYRILRGSETIAEVTKEWSWLRKKFTLDVPGPNDYRITGSFWEYEFTFERGGRVVAEASKRFFSLRDTYGVSITDGEDDALILATVVVIDLVLHEDDQG